MRTLINERQCGTRTILNTAWPVLDLLEREQLPGRKPTWIVTRGLCNGVPRGATEHRTRRAAVADFEGRP